MNSFFSSGSFPNFSHEVYIMVAAEATIMHKSLLIPYLIFQLFSIKIRIISKDCVFSGKLPGKSDSYRYGYAEWLVCADGPDVAAGVEIIVEVRLDIYAELSCDFKLHTYSRSG